MKFPELSYANPTDPWLHRTVIQLVEEWAGRDKIVPLYERWRNEVVPGPGPVRVVVVGAWTTVWTKTGEVLGR